MLNRNKVNKNRPDPKLSKEEYLKQKQLKREKRQIKREEMAEHKDSIFWVTFSGNTGFDLANSLKAIDREISWKRRKAGGGMPIDEVRGLIQKVMETAADVWEITTELIPKLHTVTFNKNREVNNDTNEKLRFAKMSYSICFLPRSYEVGYLAMGIKKIEERARELQESNLDELEKLVKKYKEVCDKVTELEKLVTSNPEARDKATETESKLVAVGAG